VANQNTKFCKLIYTSFWNRWWRIYSKNFKN